MEHEEIHVVGGSKYRGRQIDPQVVENDPFSCDQYQPCTNVRLAFVIELAYEEHI